MKIIITLESRAVFAPTLISIALLFTFLCTSASSSHAYLPEFDRSMNGIEIEAIYADHKFVGFETECIIDEMELTKKIVKIYKRYLEPFAKAKIAENDTISIISQYSSKLFGKDVESIYIHINNKHIGALRNDSSVLAEYTSDYYFDDPLPYGYDDPRAKLRQTDLRRGVLQWKASELLSMFCMSSLDGSATDNHSMNIYRIVIINNKISEYISISCNAETYWQYVPGLFYEMLSPDSPTIKWGAERAAFLNHKRPPETIEKTQLPR